jgi:mediator of RNA polymerase II transcription subunit 16
MDDDAYMQDLFGEPDNVQINTSPAIGGLPQRLDELAGSNCCQRIAWSRSGTIAVIGPDSRTINLYVLIRNPKDGSWRRSKPASVALPLDDSLQDPQPLVHLCWAHMGHELAAIDTLGRIFIYSVGSSAGQLTLSRNPASDPSQDRAGVVGMCWLAVTPHTTSKVAESFRVPSYQIINMR